MSSQKTEVRKIQVTGKSTHIVSLPKKWIDKLNLKKVDPIRLIEQDDSTLTLLPNDIRKEKSRAISAVISSSDSPDSINRKVVSFYLIGYNMIRITAKDRFTPEQRDALKDFVRRNLVGVEILNDSNSEFAMQTLLSHSELSVENTLRRMVIIATSMHRDAMAALKEDNKRLAQTIIRTDDEVDRFNFYIIRQLKYAVNDNRMIKYIGLNTPRDCLGYRLITNSVERAADHAVNIAKAILDMKPIDQALVMNIIDMSAYALSIFDEAIRSLLSNDYNEAEKVLSRKEIIENYEKDLVKTIISKELDSNTVAGLRIIIESIRRLAKYGIDIAEVVLNITAEKIGIHE
ncbi:PhoU family transcriptional regulator [Candidatus Bathyarchaeota archaeon]|nr:PhoU family transcriptional regulator [Candidatus Bathyarchaeota archaeon]